MIKRIVLFENQDIVYEMSTVSGEAWKNLAAAKPVSKSEFLQIVEPGDILVTRADASKLQGVSSLKKATGILVGKVLSTAMGVPFTSTKVCLDKHNVIGFGASGFGGGSVDIAPFNKFLLWQKNVMICRYPELTKSQQSGIIKYLISKRNLNFDHSKLLTTWWERILRGEKLLKNRLRKSNVTIHEARQWKDALFCSTITSMAYKSVGINADFTKNPTEIWPKDFVSSEDLDQLAILYL
jgi:hypothetical protein